MKTYEQLKSLKAEDFMAPNQVLCYGAGEAFNSSAPYILACGINLAGVIDAYKSGSIELDGKNFPIFSIEQAVEQFGEDTRIIITIGDEKIAQQVEQTLVQRGFDGDKIFDFNVWSWLTGPSEKSYCWRLGGCLQFSSDVLGTCCAPCVRPPFFSEWFMGGRPIADSIENFLEKRAYYVAQSKEGRIPLYCKGCSFLSQDPKDGRDKIVQFEIGDHAVCNADCAYCNVAACSLSKKTPIKTVGERYTAIISAFETLRERDLIDEHAWFIVAGGEITINPYRRQIYEIIRSMPSLKVLFYSNSFIYDQEIADILAQSKDKLLQCDLDAGTPETYIKVKGFNKFDTVKENLKKYSQHGTVILKYIVLPGWNDSDADYEGTIALLKYLGLKELLLSPEQSTIGNEPDRLVVRETLFAAARLMALLEDSGMNAVMEPPYIEPAYWTKEYKAVVKRLCRELRALKNPSGPQ